MSVQAADYVYLDNKKYVLIDIEAGKQIIDCATFDMPEDSGEIDIITACWRGYTAVYHIEEDMLYGVKAQGFGRRYFKSEKTFIPYTGSCIIAFGEFWNSDFIVSYIYYDEAFELYFEQGALKEKLTLEAVIEKFKSIEATDERARVREQIAREPLKYKYDERSYKWRNKERWVITAMTLKIKYTGKSDMSFTTGKTYSAKKLKAGEYGDDCYSVYDDDKDWFVYSGKYIRKEFEILEQI